MEEPLYFVLDGPLIKTISLAFVFHNMIEFNHLHIWMHCNFLRCKALDFRLVYIYIYQDAILDGPGRSPVEHARTVVFHLSLLKVKVLRLNN